MVLAAAPAARAGVVVSLGDSYSSGESVGPYDAGTDDKKLGHKCHRSPGAWPRLIGVAKEHHLACSGARVKNLYQGQTNDGPDLQGQLTRLRFVRDTASIDTIVLTLGGNDLGFGKKLRSCYLGNCLRDREQLKRELANLRPELVSSYRAIREVSPARLLVVGYPDLLPPPEHRDRCVWLSHGEKERVQWLAGKLERTFQAAASGAGAHYVSLRDVFKDHWLCTGDSWIRSLGTSGSPFDQQQGHPQKLGQSAMALRVSRWLADNRLACTAAGNVSAIVDDSGSMEENDPENIRGSALELLITKPEAQGRTLGAVEFGSTAGPLFAPAMPGAGQNDMLAALGALQNDGYEDDGDTDYNAAFRAAESLQPEASARIFLTDGKHNQGDYEDLHAGGPPTFVVGLNIGPDDGSDDGAALLARIAGETGGAYFPLRLSPDDSPAVQVSRLQPVLNDIDARIACSSVLSENTLTLDAPNTPSDFARGHFAGSPGIEVVISWPTQGSDVDLHSAAVANARGKVVADLDGLLPIGRSKRVRSKLIASTVEAETFKTITFARPPAGRTIWLQVVAPQLDAPLPVTVQFRPTESAPTESGTITVPTPTEPGPQQPQPDPGPPPPPRHIITVDNRVTNGMGMREDSTPARLTTQPWTFCGRRGCNINGTERSTGGTYDAAVCQTFGERTTNGHDTNASDDANPERFESTRYYGVRLPDGVFGYVSEVWIRAADRGGLGLAPC
jgi:lysophospholipase L1-like esterase